MKPLAYRHHGPDLDASRCVSVDGGAPGRLHLSHWPGNRTPAALKHDLSTGIALNLLRHPDRERLLDGIDTVTNDHTDTDGACAAFALVFPEYALTHAESLLQAALAGDLGLCTGPLGVRLDLTLSALLTRPDSPLARAFSDNRAREQAFYDAAFELIPRVIENPRLKADWVEDEALRIEADLRALREDNFDVERLDALDLAIVHEDRPLHETAVNTHTGCDRILTIRELAQGGFAFELRLTLLSWFDLVSPLRRPPRPDWAPLLADLEALNTDPRGRWQADDRSALSPRIEYRNRPATSEPFPCPVAPEAVRKAVVDFYTNHPWLPAGV